MEKTNSIFSENEIQQLLQLLKEGEEELVEEKNDYIKPQFTPLTQEEIDDIHRRGFITQEEACREWEEIGICMPGNSGSNLRCKQFNHNCVDCSIDYSLSKKEHTSIIKIMSMMGPSEKEKNNLLNALKTEEEKGYQKVKNKD